MTKWFFIFLTSASTLASADTSSENFVLRRGPEMSLADQRVDETGLKVMWWNVGCSSDSGLLKLKKRDRRAVDPENQFANLEELMKSDRLRPDVLILGEYCPSAFDESTYQTIKKEYGFKFRLDRSNSLHKIRNGLRVYSRYKIENIEQDTLSGEAFLDSDLMQNCDQAVKDRNPKSFAKDPKYRAYWDRPKISFTVEHAARTYKIAPLHLANPWRFVKSCLGLFKTPGEIKRGTQNVNYIQAEQVVESFADEVSTLLIGDFNAPKSILGQMSNSYRLLSENFGDSVIDSEHHTYSDPRTHFPEYSIDHAFASSDLTVKRAVVLPFAGSDHLPLYIVLDH